MPTSVATLIDRSRRYVRDYPLTQDVTTASLSSSGTTVTVADTTRYAVNDPIEIDTETMLVRALASGTTLTVLRGMFGSSATTHASGATVVRQPRFYASEYLDAINRGLQATFPKIYQEILDTSLTASSNVYEYTVPTMSSPAITLPFITGIDLLSAGTGVPYRRQRGWELRRGSTPKIKFKRSPTGGEGIRVHGFGPFPVLAASDSLHAQFPARCEDLLVLYAAADLLLSGEAGRVRSDVGMGDDREQANRTGSSAQIGGGLMSRFYVELDQRAMPPMPRHTVAVI